MNIGIIGAGAIGGTLARRLSSLGHQVFIANSRGPDTLNALAAETGAIAVSVREAAEKGDLVIITIPEYRVRELPKSLFDGTAREVIVVDTGNYYPQQRDGYIGAIEFGLTESQWVERHIGRPVIKAFNNIYWKHLLENGKPKGAAGRIALPVSGDDPHAKSTVLNLVEELGFDGVDAGTLASSWRQQPGSPIYGTNLDVTGARRALQGASPTRQPEWRALEPDLNNFERTG